MSNDKNEDQRIVSKLYRASAKNEPSQATDTAVLNMAKQQSAKTQDAMHQKSASSPSKRSSFYFKWQYSGSVAASVLLISFLFVIHAPEDFEAIPSSEVQSDMYVPDPAELRIRATEVAERESQNKALRRADELNERSSRHMSASKIRVETPSLNKISSEELIAESERMLAALLRMAASGNLSEATDLSNASDKTDNTMHAKPDKAELQEGLFTILKLLKERDASWTLTPSFEAVLSEEQIKELKR